MLKKEVGDIIYRHSLWLRDDPEGVRADFTGVDLCYHNLSGHDLRDAIFASAKLKRAILRGTRLVGADFSRALLHGADFSSANISGANFNTAHMFNSNFTEVTAFKTDFSNTLAEGANFYGAVLRQSTFADSNLRDANFIGADVYQANFDFACITGTALLSQCPEEGSYIAWKKCLNGVLVKLLIPEDAMRSSGTTRKCRASKAYVLDVIGDNKGLSIYNPEFVYVKGDTVEVKIFDTDRWNECSTGIHHFLTKAEAENW